MNDHLYKHKLLDEVVTLRWLVVSVVVVAAVLTWRMGAIGGANGQASFGLRSPAEASSMKLDLIASLENLKKQFTRLNLQSCANVLNDATSQVFNFSPQRLDADQLKSSSAEILQKLFELKLLLLSRSKRFAQTDLAKNTPCLSGLRLSLLSIRTLEDVLAEREVGFPEEDADEQPAVLKGKAPYFMVNPAFGTFELKSGDVLISRGTSFVGTALARLGGEHSVLSLMEVVYVDPESGKKWTVGAHIGVGAIARPLEDYLEVEKVRALVYRYREPLIAAKAAKNIFDHVKGYEAEHGESIPYDFKMDANEATTFSSAELVAQAFLEASAGQIKLPAYSSQIKMQNKDFIGRLEMREGSVFFPADLELDPRFDLVAEWRDLGRVSRSHMRDTVLTAIYEWMEHQSYTFREPSTGNMQSAVTWSLRSWPVFSTLVDDKMPSHMGQDLVSFMATFNEVTEWLFKRLDEVNDEHRRQTGFWLAKKEMLDELETYRREDQKKYDGYQKTHGYDPLVKKPDFHMLFRR